MEPPPDDLGEPKWGVAHQPTLHRRNKGTTGYRNESPQCASTRIVLSRDCPAPTRRKSQKAGGALYSVRLPKLPRKEGEPPSQHSVNGSGALPGGSVSSSRRRRTDPHGLRVAGGPKRVGIKYEIPVPDPDDLYKSEMTELDKLPLEYFDSEEFDRTPEEWIQLGVDKYMGRGAAARSPYFHNREWHWAPCHVVGYDPETALYTIKFSQFENKTKTVKRLSILFDDEDEVKFRNRIKSCRSLKRWGRRGKYNGGYGDQRKRRIAEPHEDCTILRYVLHGAVLRNHFILRGTRGTR